MRAVIKTLAEHYYPMTGDIKFHYGAFSKMVNYSKSFMRGMHGNYYESEIGMESLLHPWSHSRVGIGQPVTKMGAWR